MATEQLGAVGGDVLENIDDDPHFDTPPESLEDLRLELSPDLDSTEDYIRKNQEWINKSAESVRELKATMDKLIGQASSRKAELESRTDKLKQMKKEIEEISMEDIEKEEEELKKLIDVESVRQTNYTNGDDTTSELSSENHIQLLEENIVAYKEKLGLQTNSSQEGWVEFIFTDIDSKSADLTFCIKLKVEGGAYKCLSCEPNVTRITEMLENLNQQNDLQQFMIELRGEFKKLTDKEN